MVHVHLCWLQFVPVYNICFVDFCFVWLCSCWLPIGSTKHRSLFATQLSSSKLFCWRNNVGAIHKYAMNCCGFMIMAHSLSALIILFLHIIISFCLCCCSFRLLCFIFVLLHYVVGKNKKKKTGSFSTNNRK